MTGVGGLNDYSISLYIYQACYLVMSIYRTNPEWIKVQSEKMSSGAQKQISIFKKHSTPQNQLSKNDLKVLGKPRNKIMFNSYITASY